MWEKVTNIGMNLMRVTSTTSVETSGYGIPHRRNILTLLWGVGIILFQLGLFVERLR